MIVFGDSYKQMQVSECIVSALFEEKRHLSESLPRTKAVTSQCECSNSPYEGMFGALGMNDTVKGTYKVL